MGIKLPLLKDDKEFELLVKGYAESKFKKKFKLYGRKGQKQHGIDIISSGKYAGQIAIQCKNVAVSNVNVEKWLDEFDYSKFAQIQEFYLAIAVPNDTKIVDKINDINTSRVYPFSIDVIFWDDIENLYNLDKKFASMHASLFGFNNNVKNNNVAELLKSDFVESIKQYHIIEFLREDPEVRLTVDYYEDAWTFTDVVGIYVDKNISHKKYKIFNEIYSFNELLKEYCDFIFEVTKPVPNYIYMIVDKPKYVNRREEIRNRIKEYREKLISKYVVICK